ncbi:DUF2946 family protein [Prosthecodimorpha staleyi]|uniref:DUF2946 domain-containing protein n=1 Tax=Prosthecodimorpha staleyi TaxID=2840188 RepID=A0A947DBM9_9HYPH|nr:DUF2946 family protein [Prosthecodimorpha staleyi]MBT9292807.1 hypothetical protein [Prosthecodimorpha staleyi]
MPRRRYDLATTAALGAVRREVASALGMLVVLANLVVAMAVAAGVPAAGAQAATARALDPLGGGRIVICTGAGLVILDRDGRPIGEEPGGAVCPYCPPLMGGSIDLPAELPLAENARTTTAAGFVPAPARVRPTIARSRGTPPTGPPAL